MSNIENLMKEINKNEVIATFGVPEKDIPRIPFSSPRANYMLYGGVPKHRVIEFAGPEGSGKTTSALDIVGNYQKLPDAKRVLYVDYECTFDPVWAGKMGVNVQDMVVLTPSYHSAEDIFDLIMRFAETNEVGLIVIDSIASLVPKQIKGKEMEQQQYGGISKSLARFVNDFVPNLKKHDCTLIGINQVRDDMDSMFNNYKTPGGHAWAHACSLRIMFSIGDLFDSNYNTVSRRADNPYGQMVNMFLKKSKFCNSDRKNGFYTLTYQHGIDGIYDTVDCAIKFGIIQARGAWFTIVDFNTGEVTDKKFQGKSSVINYYREHPEEYNELWEFVNSKVCEEE